MTSTQDGASLWQAIRARIENEPRFQSLVPWLNRLQLLEPMSDNPNVTLIDSSLSDVFTPNLRSLLNEAVQQTIGLEVALESPVDRDVSHNNQFSFDTFETGPSNRLAFAAAQAVLSDSLTRYNPLYFHGGIGLGKTHLLNAIANSSSFHKKMVFSTEDFCSKLIKSVEENALNEFYSSLDVYDVILFDDIHRLSNFPNLHQEFLGLFDHFHGSDICLIFSSLLPPKSMSFLPDALTSRLRWGLVVEIESPGPDLVANLLRNKSNLLELALDDEIIRYIAEKPFHSIRDIESVLNKIQGLSSLLSHKIDRELIDKVLLENERSDESDSVVTIIDIQNAICDFFGIPKDSLLSKSRARSVAYPRQVGMFLAKSMTTSSLEEIGKSFGGRDHSTVKHGCEKIKRLTMSDPAVRNTIQQCKRKLIAK